MSEREPSEDKQATNATDPTEAEHAVDAEGQATGDAETTAEQAGTSEPAAATEAIEEKEIEKKGIEEERIDKERTDEERTEEERTEEEERKEHAEVAQEATQEVAQEGDSADNLDTAGEDSSQSTSAAELAAAAVAAASVSGGDAESPAPAAKPKGRVLGFLALLLALAAAGGVGYLYYELIYLKPIADVAAKSTALQQQYQTLDEQLSTQIQAVEQNTTAALGKLESAQAERLASNEEAVLKSLNEALSTAPPSQREWKLAEAEYLLRIANHRVLMEQDSVGALTLLQSADQILAELDDFSLYQVRARLADEIIALRQVPRDDLQGIYLRIEALKSQIDNLALPEPAYLTTETAPPAEQPVWKTMLDELKKYVRIRTLETDESLKPLLAPDEVRYLELNLRLALEQAQLATLKRQQDVYEQSLLNVRGWLVDHADIGDPRTQAMLTQIDELSVVELAQPLPEISGSLNELLSIRRGES